jgi:hypothetical protein
VEGSLGVGLVLSTSPVFVVLNIRQWKRNYGRCHFCTEVQLLGFQSALSPESGLGTEGRNNGGGMGI